MTQVSTKSAGAALLTARLLGSAEGIQQKANRKIQTVNPGHSQRGDAPRTRCHLDPKSPTLPERVSRGTQLSFQGPKFSAQSGVLRLACVRARQRTYRGGVGVGIEIPKEREFTRQLCRIFNESICCSVL